MAEECKAYQEDLIAHEFMRHGSNCSGCGKAISIHDHRPVSGKVTSHVRPSFISSFLSASFNSYNFCCLVTSFSSSKCLCKCLECHYFYFYISWFLKFSMIHMEFIHFVWHVHVYFQHLYFRLSLFVVLILDPVLLSKVYRIKQ